MRFNRNKNRRGASTVEFALTLPLLFFFLFSTYELSRANMMVHTIESAAYEGARVGIVPGAQNQESIDAANLILSTSGIRNATVTVTPDLASPSENVSVTITMRYSDNSIVAPFFMRESTLTRTCQMTREQL